MLTFLTVFLSLFVLPWIQPSEAQKSSMPRDEPVLGAEGQGAIQESSLNLTEAQKKSLEELRYMYMKEAIPMKRSLSALKIGLRHSLLDPNVQPQILFDQQRKISALQAKLDELSLSYQIKARSIFTKEQLERLPQAWAFEIGLGYEITIMDMGRRSKKRVQ